MVMEGILGSLLEERSGPLGHLRRPLGGHPKGPALLGPEGPIFVGPDGPMLLSERGPLTGPMGSAQGPGTRSRMPVNFFHELFPGPLRADMHSGVAVASPFDAPDPLVLDMLQEFGQPFHNEVLPMIHMAGGARQAPLSCRGDLREHCGSARSQLHCLGKHREDISEPCRKDVGKSVPFLCSRAIDRFCSLLEQGILSCLSSHMQEVGRGCRDSIMATQEVIEKVHTQKVSVTDPQTGEKRVHTPTPEPPTKREARLDLQLNGQADSDRIAQQPVAAADRTWPNLPSLPVAPGNSATEGSWPTGPEHMRNGTLRIVAMLGAVTGLAYLSFCSDYCKTLGFAKSLLYRRAGWQTLQGGVEMPKPAVAL